MTDNYFLQASPKVAMPHKGETWLSRQLEIVRKILGNVFLARFMVRMLQHATSFHGYEMQAGISPNCSASKDTEPLLFTGLSPFLPAGGFASETHANFQWFAVHKRGNVAHFSGHKSSGLKETEGEFRLRLNLERTRLPDATMIRR